MTMPNKQFKIEKLKEASEIKAMLKFYNKRTNQSINLQHQHILYLKDINVKLTQQLKLANSKFADIEAQHKQIFVN